MKGLKLLHVIFCQFSIFTQHKKKLKSHRSTEKYMSWVQNLISPMWINKSEGHPATHTAGHCRLTLPFQGTSDDIMLEKEWRSSCAAGRCTISTNTDKLLHNAKEKVCRVTRRKHCEQPASSVLALWRDCPSQSAELASCLCVLYYFLTCKVKTLRKHCRTLKVL